MLITNIQALNAEDRSAVFAAFGFDAAAVKPTTIAKKPRSNLGKSTAQGDYVKKVLAEHNKDSAEFKSFLARRVAAAEAGEMLYSADQGKVKSGKKAVGDRMTVKEATAGAHIPFAAEWKREHQAEWLAFKAEWELAHPKVATTSAEPSDDVSTIGDDEATGAVDSPPVPVAPKAKRGPKKMADMTPEEQVAAKAKRAAKKAEKASSATNSGQVSRSPSPPKIKDD